MITRTVSESLRTLLREVFDTLEEVDVLDSRDTLNLGLLSRPELGVTFTKIHCWRLTQYTKAVFMDADTLVLQNVDDLFEREEFSASPDPGWPDCFNSGVFVFRPSVDKYASILQCAMTTGSFDGGDQGLLNMYFDDWRSRDIKNHLPFTYNCVSQAFYSYLPAVTHFRSTIKVVHFIGPVKPWHHELDATTGQVVHQQGTGFFPEFLQHWWSIFMNNVKPKLSQDIAGLTQQLSSLSVERKQSGGGGGGGHADQGGAGPPTVDERERQYMWERGEIDYTGADRFDQIKHKIDRTIKDGESKKEEEKKEEKCKKEQKK